MSNPTVQQITGPIEPKRRLDAVDMVRGFALFGIMLVNMYNFGASSLDWTAPIDELAFSVKRFFFETKSWRLFSFLFGFGFALQMLRAEQRGARSEVSAILSPQIIGAVRHRNGARASL